MVNKMLGSVFDKPVSATKPVQEVKAPVVDYAIPGRETKATKQSMLASHDPLTGKSSLEGYNAVKSDP